jgi:hypothetical protein
MIDHVRVIDWNPSNDYPATKISCCYYCSSKARYVQPTSTNSFRNHFSDTIPFLL